MAGQFIHKIARYYFMRALMMVCLLLMAVNPVFAAEKDASECYRYVATTMVHTSAAGLSELLKNVKNEGDRINTMRSYISNIRFYPDKSGYFYIYDYNCVNIAHATQKDLPGKNLYNHKDVKGSYVIRKLSAAAKSGGGFVEFYWVKPGAKDEYKKMGYVEPIPGTDYFIGTGIYLPDGK